MMLNAFSNIFLYLVVYFIVEAFVKNRNANTANQDFRKSVRLASVEDPEKALIMLQQREVQLKKRIKWMKCAIGLYIVMLLMYFVMVVATVRVATSAASIRATFIQRLELLGPYLDSSAERKLRAQFAAIKNKEDFIKIEEDLQKIALANKAILPKLIVW